MAEELESRESLTKKEIIEILEKNVELYRNEPNFVKYLVELAVYLIEYRYEKTQTKTGARKEPPKGHPSTDSEMGHEGANIYALHSRFNRKAVGRCRFCGALLQNMTKCPVCGLMNV